MLRTLIEGFALGLSTGSICLATCTPIYLPYLLTEERKLSKSLIKVAEISAGRFFSYLAFGAAAGYAGANISSIDREIFTSIAYILLSIYLILSAYRTHQHDKKCHVPKIARFTRNSFILGILTGINFCPAFLIALSKAVNLGGMFSGMFLFLGFFFGTTLFLIPLAFFGLLSKIKVMKLIAQIASVLIAIWFIFTGIKGIIHWNEHRIISKEPARMVEAFAPNQSIIIISSKNNFEYFLALKDSISSFHNAKIKLNKIEIIAPDSLKFDPDFIIFADSELFELKSNNLILENFDYFQVETDYPISQMLNFLRKFTFKTRDKLHWKFSLKDSS